MRDGRLLLFTVADLYDEADDADQKNTKLEQVCVCNHGFGPPFPEVRGQQKVVSPLRKARWGAARLPFIGSTVSVYHNSFPITALSAQI